MFLVVKFLMSDEVEVIPECWLRDQETCVWPSSKEIGINNSIGKAKRDQLTPEGSWRQYNIKILSKYLDSYEEAKRKAFVVYTKFEASTDYNYLPKRRLASIPARFRSSSDSDDEHGPRIKKRKLSSALTTQELVQEIQSMKKMIEKLLDSNARLTQICETTQQMVISMRQVQCEFAEEPLNSENVPCLPISAQEGLCVVENYICENAANRRQLVRLLSKVGGTSADNLVKRILKKTFTVEFGAGFSLRGKKGKEAFDKLNLYKVIVDAVRAEPMFSDATDCNIDKSIGNWLKYTPEKSLKFQRRNFSVVKVQMEESESDD